MALDYLLGRYPITTTYGAPAATTGAPHYGIDIGAPEGERVNASLFGSVRRVFRDTVGGLQVEVEDSRTGVRALFAHLARALVGEGDPVGADTPIGTVGSSGTVTGPHLHVEARDAAGRLLNPVEAFIGPRDEDGSGFGPGAGAGGGGGGGGGGGSSPTWRSPSLWECIERDAGGRCTRYRGPFGWEIPSLPFLGPVPGGDQVGKSIEENLGGIAVAGAIADAKRGASQALVAVGVIAVAGLIGYAGLRKLL